MAILEQIGIGVITGTIGSIMGLVGLFAARNRLRDYVKHELAVFFMEFAQMLAENPEQIRPLVQKLMPSIIGGASAGMPREATIKVPMFGKLPASWFEPIVKQGLGRLMGGAAKEAEKEAANALFG